MSHFDDDCVSNASSNETFDSVLAARMSRRSVLGGGVAATVAASIGGVSALLNAVPVEARSQRGPLLGFQGVTVSSEDRVVVPEGYTAEVLIAWGDPLSDGPAFKPDASNSAYEQSWQWGMHNDGMVYFPFRGSHHGLLVQNHEYTDEVLLFPDGTANWNEEKTKKSLHAHGVSVIEVAKARVPREPWDQWGKRGRWGRKGDDWRVVRPSYYARRITGLTPIRIGGPAAGDSRLVTSEDPSGRTVLGTINNCAMGYTPWGTYLACEEKLQWVLPQEWYADRARASLWDQCRRRGLSLAHH